MPPMPCHSSSGLTPMPTKRYGTPLRDEGYTIFDPEPLMSKAPWSTPSPVLYGRSDHGVPEPPYRFPFRYAPQLLPDEPPRYRQHGVYQGKGKSQLVAGAGGDHNMGGGGQPGGAPGPSNTTNKERLEQVCALYNMERQRADRLEQEIRNLKAQ